MPKHRLLHHPSRLADATQMLAQAFDIVIVDLGSEPKAVLHLVEASVSTAQQSSAMGLLFLIHSGMRRRN
ncbi:MAG: hypothetical protein ABSF16_10165 [Terracidiphilus sp.]